MAIVQCFEGWRAELESAPHPVNVLSDQKKVEYLMFAKLINRWQARWSELLFFLTFKLSTELVRQVANWMLSLDGRRLRY